MSSIRARLLIALFVLVALVSLIAAGVTYRRVLSETSTLFDYQLRQTALSLRSQISFAARIVEIPPDQGDTDFVVQIWDIYGARTYVSRPGLPTINQTVLGYADLSLRGQPWRAYGLQTADGVIQIAQPVRVRENLARASAVRVIVPLILLLPIMIVAVAWIVNRGLLPLRFVTTEVQRRDVQTLAPLGTANLPREIEPLVGELNRLLERLRLAFSAQRAFISDAAHELRSPLTALRLQLQLLDRATDEKGRAEARERLGAGVERGIHLVEQLLALARSEPQEAALSSGTVDLSAAAAAGVRDAHDLALTRNIDLGLSATADLKIMADPESLRALVRNLLDNAVRYTPPQGTVRVQTRATENEALLEVIDNGPGIPPEERERVFDRFYRRAAAHESGTGLGLAIVKAIAERHGARVTLGTASGGGLYVTVAFPRHS
jgi:signal transduction histidine kinase